MHAQEDLRSVTSLLDGEVDIAEKDVAKGSEKILKVRKLINQRYLEDEQLLTAERLLQWSKPIGLSHNLPDSLIEWEKTDSL